MQNQSTLRGYERLSTACKALSHPARLAILKTLADRGTCICGEIVDALPLSQATVSQHLKVLQQVGLINGEIDGPRSCYCLNASILQELRDELGHLFKSLENCC